MGHQRLTSDPKEKKQKKKNIQISIIESKAREWLWVDDSVPGTDTMIGDESERMSQKLLQTTHPGKWENRLLSREI